MWPFKTKQAQEQRNYTDMRVQAATVQVTGSAFDVRKLAPVVAAVGLWGRSLAMGSIEPATPATRIIGPSIMDAIGRALALHGEALFVLDVGADQRLRAVQSSSWDVYGIQDWRYRADISGPSGSVTRNVPADGVLHFRLYPNPSEPHRGCSPLDAASESSTVAAAVEALFRKEASANHGYVIPAPMDGMDGGDLDALQGDLRTLQGRSTLVPSMQRGWADSGVGPGTANWRSVRFGFDPTTEQVKLRDQSAMEILGALGVPPELFSRDGEGTGRREAWRQFLHGSIQPVADMIAEELALKLDQSVAISFDRLFASDIQGRARAFASLTAQGEGLDVAAAASATGLSV